MDTQKKRIGMLALLAVFGVAWWAFQGVQRRNEQLALDAVARNAREQAKQYSARIDRQVREGIALIEGAKCFEREQLDRGRAQLRERPSAPALRMQTDIAVARYELAIGGDCSTSVDPKHLSLAETALQSALSVDPRSQDALVLLGGVLIQADRFEEAMQHLQAADALGSKDAMLQVNFALAYIGMHDLQRAAERLQRVPRCQVGAEDAFQCGGKAASHSRIALWGERGDLKAIEQEYLQSIREFPDSAFLRGNFAEHLIRVVGNIDAAIEQANAALAVRRYPMAERALALALYAKAAEVADTNPGAAKKAQDQARQFVPDVESLLPRLGWGIGGNPATQRLVKRWIADGYSLDAVDGNANSALVYAASAGRPADLRWLLRHGAAIDLTNVAGLTPLAWAAVRGREGNVETLLDADANARIATKVGDTALHFAAERGHLAIVKRLIDAKADINAVNARGITPLMVAAHLGRKEAIEALLAAGADVTVRTNDGGKDAALLAEEANFPDVAALIRVR